MKTKLTYGLDCWMEINLADAVQSQFTAKSNCARSQKLI